MYANVSAEYAEKDTIETIVTHPSLRLGDTPVVSYPGQVLLLTCAMVLRCCRINADAYGVYTPGHATPLPPLQAEQCRRCPRNN